MGGVNIISLFKTEDFFFFFFMVSQKMGDSKLLLWLSVILTVSFIMVILVIKKGDKTLWRAQKWWIISEWV